MTKTAMKFVPIRMKYDPERNVGDVELLEAVWDGEQMAAVGDTSIDFKLSSEACEKIAAILKDEQARILSEIFED